MRLCFVFNTINFKYNHCLKSTGIRRLGAFRHRCLPHGGLGEARRAFLGDGLLESALFGVVEEEDDDELYSSSGEQNRGGVNGTAIDGAASGGGVFGTGRNSGVTGIRARKGGIPSGVLGVPT